MCGLPIGRNVTQLAHALTRMNLRLALRENPDGRPQCLHNDRSTEVEIMSVVGQAGVGAESDCWQGGFSLGAICAQWRGSAVAF